jgi:kynureninase
MGHADPFAFEAAPIRLAANAHRFNTGTPTVPGYLAARAGHDAILDVGVETIHAHNIRLTTALADGALARGFAVPTPLDPGKRTGWIGMDFDGADRAAAALFERRVFVDYRPGCGLRVSPHFYTSDADIDAFFAAIDEIRGVRA